MAWVERRVTRTSQPQELVGLDWSNPLTAGLVFSNVPATDMLLKSGEVSRVAGQIGTATYIDGTKYAFANSAPLTSVKENTMLLIMSVDRVDAVQVQFPFCFGSSASNTPIALLSVLNSSGLLEYRVRDNAGVDQSSGGSINVVPGAITTLIGTRSESAGYHRLHVNGAVAGSTAASTTSAFSVNRTSIGALLRASPALYCAGNYYLSLAWNRALSDAEVKSLNDNPWQIFEPITEYVWVDDFIDVGGGATYTLTATGTALTFTGQQTSLSAQRVLQATPASFDYTGQSADLLTNRVLSASPTAITLTGQTAGLYASRALYATPAEITLTGHAVDLTYSGAVGPTYTLTATAASLAFTGQQAALSYYRVLSASSASFTLTGNAVELTYSPTVYPTKGRPISDMSNTGWSASSGTDLYAMIDEVTPDESDYIVTTSVGAAYTFELNRTAYPGTASQRFRYRASSSTGNSLIVRIKEGATVIRSETQALAGVDTEYSITLTPAEIAAISSGVLAVELVSA